VNLFQNFEDVDLVCFNTLLASLSCLRRLNHLHWAASFRPLASPHELSQQQWIFSPLRVSFQLASSLTLVPSNRRIGIGKFVGFRIGNGNWKNCKKAGVNLQNCDLTT